MRSVFAFSVVLLCVRSLFLEWIMMIDGSDGPSAHHAQVAAENCVVTEVKVRSGDEVQKGSVLCCYSIEAKPNVKRKLRAKRQGIVQQMLVTVGQSYKKGETLLFLQEVQCKHPFVCFETSI